MAAAYLVAFGGVADLSALSLGFAGSEASPAWPEAMFGLHLLALHFVSG